MNELETLLLPERDSSSPKDVTGRNTRYHHNNKEDYWQYYMESLQNFIKVFKTEYHEFDKH